MIRNSVSYPQAQTVCEDYIAKVQMVFHIKEEYGGGDYVSVKTYVPTVQSRVVSHNITTYFPYYMRPEGEGERERWLHRWDWVL